MREATLAPAAPLEIVRHPGRLESLAADWERLLDPRHPGAAFRSFPWLSAWWNHCSHGAELHVLTARRSGQLIGLLPLYVERTPLGGRRLRLVGDGPVGSDYLGVIARRDDEAACAAAFGRALTRLGADEIELDDVADDDPLTAVLPGAVLLSRYRCPHIVIEQPFEDFLAQLPDGLGAQWHRRRRWLERRPGFSYRVLQTPAELGPGLETLLELHRRRWALDGGSDAIFTAAVEAFHREAALRLAERGWARLWLLEAEGAARAALYGFRHGDRLVYYQAGHDPEWRQRSVGTVLLGLILRDAFAEGLSEFDFLRGEEPYKLRWANGARHTVRVRRVGDGLRPRLNDAGRTLYWRVRNGMKRALPEETLGWLRRQKKRWRVAT